ncbi:MAG: DegV family protein [Erysipelotrichales bacterium]|nr:DegV family protein [Erysipelotrichales bacterium]
MDNFLISVDSSCDCAIDELKENDISVIFFSYTDGKENYFDTLQKEDYLQFYEDMHNGICYKTSQIPVARYLEYFESLLKKNKNIIHISLCLGLSNTIEHAREAANILMKKHPGSDIKIVDSRIASLGVTLLVKDALILRNQGSTLDNAYKLLTEKSKYVNTFYTTSTLTYFVRGGRLSKIGGIIGNILKINPVLSCAPNGELKIVEKARGRKQAINYITKRVAETVINPEQQIIHVCNAVNEEGAKALAIHLKETIGFKDYVIYPMGTTIGAHTGPGLLAVFYYGKERL